jgi:hypothetical protein
MSASPASFWRKGLFALRRVVRLELTDDRYAARYVCR